MYRSHEPQCNLNYTWGPDHYDQDGILFCETSTVDWSENRETYTSLFTKISESGIANSGDTLDYKESTIGWLTFDMTDEVKGMLAEPSFNNGFNFRAEVKGANATTWGTIGNTSNFRDPGRSGVLGSYVSANNSDLSKSPKLVIEYTGTGVVEGQGMAKSNANISYKSGKLSLTVSRSGTYNVTIMSIQGRAIVKKTIELHKGRNTLELGDLPTGMYITTLQSDGFYESGKVVVQ